MENKNALSALADTRQDGNEKFIHRDDTTFKCGLSIGRIAELMELIDLFNQQFNGIATLSLTSRGADIHVTMCHVRKSSYKCFETEDTFPASWHNVCGDTNLEKAEAFMKMLIRAADHCEAMRGFDYEREE